jgi:Domain of unknown function (DUF4041)/Meiotically up-regulated gene 113
MEWMLAGAAMVAAAGAGLLWFKARTALLAERRSFDAFKAKYPPDFLRLTGEVEQLAAQRASLAAEILKARETAAAESAAEEQAQVARREDWKLKFAQAGAELDALQADLQGVNAQLEMQSYGVYEPQYEFTRSVEYKAKLESIREQQKEMIREKTAATCSTNWQVGGSAAEGRRMTERQLKLMLRAFNGECEAATASVTWKNIKPLQERIRKSFEAINKLGETVQCAISMAYLKQKLDELDVAYGYAEKVQAEREEQRELREQMREEEKANRELEREREDAEKESDRYEKALEKARAEVQKSNSAEHAAIDAKVAKLEALLAKAEERKNRAISQAELTKLGYVYILSNEGTFGPNVFKVGMTRRLDPQDRVDELGNASVPFRFDVHAIIRSDDAPRLEQTLHDALEPHRINLVNHRKEYFRVPLEKIIDLVSEHHGQVEITKYAEAAEYRKSLAIRAEREAMVAGKAAHAAAVSRASELKARQEAIWNN